MDKDQIGFLMTECSKYPETYNKISNKLWKHFKIADAVISLLCTWIVIQLIEEEYKDGFEKYEKKKS